MKFAFTAYTFTPPIKYFTHFCQAYDDNETPFLNAWCFFVQKINVVTTKEINIEAAAPNLSFFEVRSNLECGVGSKLRYGIFLLIHKAGGTFPERV